MLIKKSLTWELSGEKICHLAWWVRKWLLEASTWGNVIKDLLLLCASCHHLFIADYASSTPWKIDLEATAQSFFFPFKLTVVLEEQLDDMRRKLGRRGQLLNLQQNGTLFLSIRVSGTKHEFIWQLGHTKCYNFPLFFQPGLFGSGGTSEIF